MRGKTIFIFLLTFFVISCGFSLQAYKITINNPNSETLTDFQVKITLNSSLSGFWDKVNHDGTNFRFYDINLTKKLPYWVEKWDYNNKKAIVWIKVHSLKPGDNYVYLAITNDTKSESDGDKVFEFFDDFNGNSLDTNKWLGLYDLYNQGIHQTVYLENGNVVIKATSSDTDGLIINKEFSNNKYIIKTKYSTSGATNMQAGIILKYNLKNTPNDKYYVVRHVLYYQEFTLMRFDGGTSQTRLSEHRNIGNYYSGKIEVVIDDNTISGKLYDAKDNLVSEVSATDTKYNYKYFGLWSGYDKNTIIKYDWIFVRKYADKEPTITNISEFNLVKISASFLINKTTDYYFKFETIPVNVSNTYNTTKEVDFKFFVDNISVENKTINISANSSIIENISTLTYYLTHGEHVLRLDYSYFDPDQNQTVNNTITKTIFVVRFNNTEYNVTKDIYQYQVSILYNRNISSDLGVVGDFTILNEENTLEGNYSLLHYKIENNTLYYRIFSKDTTGTDNYFVKISIDWSDNVSYNFSYNFNITNNENNLTFKYIEAIEGDISKINVTFQQPISKEYFSEKIIAASNNQSFEYDCSPLNDTVLECSAEVPQLKIEVDMDQVYKETFSLEFILTPNYIPTQLNISVGNLTVYSAMLTLVNTNNGSLSLSMKNEEDTTKDVYSDMYCELIISNNKVSRSLVFYRSNIHSIRLYKPLNKPINVSGRCLFGDTSALTTDRHWLFRNRVFEDTSIIGDTNVIQYLLPSDVLTNKYDNLIIGYSYVSTFPKALVVMTRLSESGDLEVIRDKTDSSGRLRTSVKCGIPYNIFVYYNNKIYTTTHIFSVTQQEEGIYFQDERDINYTLDYNKSVAIIYNWNDTNLTIDIISLDGEQHTVNVSVFTLFANSSQSILDPNITRTYLYKDKVVVDKNTVGHVSLPVPVLLVGQIFLEYKVDNGNPKQIFIGYKPISNINENIFLALLSLMFILVLFRNDRMTMFIVFGLMCVIFTVLGIFPVDLSVILVIVLFGLVWFGG